MSIKLVLLAELMFFQWRALWQLRLHTLQVHSEGTLFIYFICMYFPALVVLLGCECPSCRGLLWSSVWTRSSSKASWSLWWTLSLQTFTVISSKSWCCINQTGGQRTAQLTHQLCNFIVHPADWQNTTLMSFWNSDLWYFSWFRSQTCWRESISLTLQSLQCRVYKRGQIVLCKSSDTKADTVEDNENKGAETSQRNRSRERARLCGRSGHGKAVCRQQTMKRRVGGLM